MIRIYFLNWYNIRETLFSIIFAIFFFFCFGSRAILITIAHYQSRASARKRFAERERERFRNIDTHIYTAHTHIHARAREQPRGPLSASFLSFTSLYLRLALLPLTSWFLFLYIVVFFFFVQRRWFFFFFTFCTIFFSLEAAAAGPRVTPRGASPNSKNATSFFVLLQVSCVLLLFF